MNEENDMFGAIAEPENTETETRDDGFVVADEVADTEAADEVVDVKDEEGEDERRKDKTERKAAQKANQFSEFPKKDIGVGGAGFCNIFVRKMMNGEIPQDICDKVKSGEKTLQGCWNWIYSKMYDDYVKSNGRVSGGFGEDVAHLIVTYFAEIPEGTVVIKSKADKPTSVGKGSSAREKKIVSVAKKAAKDAKKEAGKSDNGGDLFDFFGI